MSGLPSPDLRARILAQARTVPSPTIADRRRRTALAACLGAGASLLLSFYLGVPTSRASGVLLAVALGGGLSALVATWVAVSRGHSMLGRSRGVLTGVTVLAPLVLLVWAVVVTGFDGGVVLSGGTTRQHLACVVFTLLFALGPFVAFAYARRGTDPVHPRLLGAALGAAAGAWGAAMIDVHCKVTAVEHLVLGHALPVVALSAIGALIGASVFGVHAKRS
jgi:hypothetical protein